MKKIAVILFVLLLPAVSYAEEFRYSFVGVAYGWINLQDPDPTFKGPGVGVYVDVTPNIYVGANYIQVETAENLAGPSIVMEGYGADVGYHTPLFPQIDLVVEAGVARTAAGMGAGGSLGTIKSQGLGLGVRAWAIPGIEVNGGLYYVRSDGSGEADPYVGTVIGLGEQAAVSFDYSWDTDSEVYEVGFRYYF